MKVYLRLAGVLARRGNPRKAMLIEHFEKRVARADAGTFTPTGKQRRALSTMQPYLYALIDQNAENLSKPAMIDCSSEVTCPPLVTPRPASCAEIVSGEGVNGGKQ